MVGYKPPYGRYPLPAGASFDPYVQGGPMTRTVADAARMSNIMSGPDPLDHTALTRKLTIPADPPGVAGMRIAVSYDLGHYQVIDEVRRETRAALDALADAGAEIVEVDLGDLSETIRLAHGAQEFVSAGAITEAVEKHGNLVSDYVPELARTAQSFSADDYRRGLSLAGEVWRMMALIRPASTVCARADAGHGSGDAARPEDRSSHAAYAGVAPELQLATLIAGDLAHLEGDVDRRG